MSKAASITVTDTAKLVRMALKEGFPDVKFGVRSSKYANGASIQVRWTDGPSAELVDGLIDRFGGAYFDAFTDYKGARLHRLDGELVHFVPDWIICCRQHSDQSVQNAIRSVYEGHAKLFHEGQLSGPTVEDYRTGRLHKVYLGPEPEPCEIFEEPKEPRSQSMSDAVGDMLTRSSDRITALHSPTADRVTISRADNDELAVDTRPTH